MKYDFDIPVNRFGTNSYKYDTMPNEDTIPLWVADMDFETAPVIMEALRKRVQHGCFGYTAVPDSYYHANIEWINRRHGWLTEKDWYIYTTGVVPAVSAIIKAMTSPGDKVLVQTPVYNCFFSCISNNRCVLADNTLLYVEGSDNTLPTYRIDYADFERQCADPAVKVFLLCNPHNPAGRVWTADELRKMGEICQRNGVFVISDEIHCEFVNNCRYTPFATVSNAPCAVCVSPSKTFNIAGLQIANIIVPDETIRKRINKAININEVCDVNPFGVIALQSAYTPEGEEWMNQMKEYIYSNYDFARTYIAEHLPMLKVTKLEGTYLMWVNISALGIPSHKLAEQLLEQANVCVNAGLHYGMAGRDFIRINLATQRQKLCEGLKRIAKVCGGHK